MAANDAKMQQHLLSQVNSLGGKMTAIQASHATGTDWGLRCNISKFVVTELRLRMPFSAGFALFWAIKQDCSLAGARVELVGTRAFGHDQAAAVQAPRALLQKTLSQLL